MRTDYARVFELRGPFAWAVLAVTLLLGLVLAVWILASALVLALLLPLFAYGYAFYLRLRQRRWRRLPPGGYRP